MTAKSYGTSVGPASDKKWDYWMSQGNQAHWAATGSGLNAPTTGFTTTYEESIKFYQAAYGHGLRYRGWEYQPGASLR